jgi:hypothetical protein
VYSSDPTFVEADVVRGYLAQPNAEPKSIIVRFLFDAPPEGSDFTKHAAVSEDVDFQRDPHPTWDLPTIVHSRGHAACGADWRRPVDAYHWSAGSNMSNSNGDGSRFRRQRRSRPGTGSQCACQRERLEPDGSATLPTSSANLNAEVVPRWRSGQSSIGSLKSVFRALRQGLDVGIPRAPKRLPYVPSEEEIRHTMRPSGRPAASAT